MKIEILKNCLDTDNRAILVAKSAQEEDFEQIWSEFEKKICAGQCGPPPGPLAKFGIAFRGG